MTWYIDKQFSHIAILDDQRPPSDRVVCHLPAVYEAERERSEENARTIVELFNQREVKMNDSAKPMRP